MANMFRFEEIGLDNRDKRVYEALLTSPMSSLRKLAADTGINRGSVYESVKRLAEHGLVGSLEVGRQRKFTATKPQAIIELLKERQESAAQAERAAEEYLRHLATITPPAEETKPFATFYEDHEGVAAILRDVIATCRGRNGNTYRVISTKRVRQYLYHNFSNFTQRRIAENIAVRVIAVGTGGAVDDLSERRWLETTRGEAPNCYTIIYGNKTAHISIDEANVLSAIVIDNEGVTHLQKELFDKLWNDLG